MSSLTVCLQLNPIQLKDAAHFMAQFPDVPVCIDHIACLRLRDCTLDERDAMIAEWREGMRECATLPHVYVKISQLWFVLFGWHEKDSAEELLVKSLVKVRLTSSSRERLALASHRTRIDRLYRR
jgi:predicted TIM-barrel fold metal-dependent hydrolase